MYYEKLQMVYNRKSRKTQILYGSSRFVQDVAFPCDRCFCLGDFITISDGTLHVDMDALDDRLTVNRSFERRKAPWSRGFLAMEPGLFSHGAGAF